MRALALFAATVLLLAGFAPSGDDRKQARIRVTMTPETCRAAPIQVEVGETLFKVVNRTRASGTFTITGRRTRYLGPGTIGRLRVTFKRPGVYRFSCVSQGPLARVRTGVVAVHPAPLEPPPPPSSL